MSVLQLIDGDKKFNAHVADYLSSTGITGTGLHYHVISVFGSQSSGKSTLLNAVFGTKFGVMDERNRTQTTKGIWMGHSAHGPQPENSKGPEPLLVLDVEGTDGRERGEDQDFERKAALFALATSEVLIVNMWEHQVGLYQGANMALLRTVFEVNLSLFVAGGGQKPARSRILFVIRDYLGQTPLDNLADILRDEMAKHWESIAKPPGLEESTIHDFFDLDFAALPHKVLQRAEFETGITQLQHQFAAATIWKPEYKRQVPLDGWPMYADQIWQQIELNKDLDLPTQQTLVARFRCEEISAETFDKFVHDVEGLGLDLSGAVLIENFGETFGRIRNRVLEHYDSLASRYPRQVYNEKRFELLGKVDGLLTTHYQTQLTTLKRESLALFESKLAVKSDQPFKDRLEVAKLSAHTSFVDGARAGVVDPSFYSFSLEQSEFETALDAAAASHRRQELQRITVRLGKQMAKRLELIHLHFSEGAASDPWMSVRHALDTAVADALAPYPEEDFGIGATPQETAEARKDVIRAAWKALEIRVREMTRPETVAQRLRDRFEDSFRYTPEGLPIVWTGKDDIEGSCVRARNHALLILPLYARATLEDGTILRPPVDLEVDDTDDDSLDYGELMTPSQQDDVRRRVKRFADAAFVDAKRSAAQSEAHVPLWMIGLLVILGWNEFMAVLRNPLLLVMLLVAAAGGYTLWSLNLWGPALGVTSAMFDRVQVEAKARLREYLLDNNDEQAVTEPSKAAESNASREVSAPASSPKLEDSVPTITTQASQPQTASSENIEQ